MEAVNAAQAQRAAAQAELDGVPAPSALTEAEVYAMIDSLVTWRYRMSPGCLFLVILEEKNQKGGRGLRRGGVPLVSHSYRLIERVVQKGDGDR